MPDRHVKAGTPLAREALVMAKPAGPRCNLACAYCYYRPKAALFPETLSPAWATSSWRISSLDNTHLNTYPLAEDLQP